MLNAARLAILIALTLNVKRGLAVPMPPESAHEWTAITICIILGAIEAVAFLAIGSPRRSASVVVYSLGILGSLAVITHTPMLIHMVRDHEPVGFFAMALVEGVMLGLAAAFRWWHEHRAPPLQTA